MSEMEYRGQELLDKWVSGDITYLQELELFELAEKDAILKDALEGYIGQEVVFEKEVLVSEVADKTIVKEEDEKVKPLFIWWKSAVAAMLVVALVSTFYIFQINQEGNEGENYTVTVKDLDVNQTKRNIETIEEESIEPSLPVVFEEQAVTKKKSKQWIPPLKEEYKITTLAKVDQGEIMITVADVNEQLEPIIKEQKIINPDKLLDSEIALSPATKSEFQGKEVIPEGMTKEDIAFFKSESNELDFKSDVRRDVLKDANRDDAITAYEIDVKSGVDPNQLNGEIDFDSINKLNKISEINPSVVIASSNKSILPKKIESDIVIKEYSIKKMDIINPPIEDYHSLVRTKYKRKGAPSVGFFKYKHVLKQSVSCLIDNYQNVSMLEEVLIIFRVHKDGEIEFLELFGINNENCIQSVSSIIENGPEWELKEYYESIDIEIPLKVLYPYMF